MTTNGGLATRMKFWFGIKVEVDGKHYILQADIPPYEGHESNYNGLSMVSATHL